MTETIRILSIDDARKAPNGTRGAAIISASPAPIGMDGKERMNVSIRSIYMANYVMVFDKEMDDGRFRFKFIKFRNRDIKNSDWLKALNLSNYSLEDGNNLYLYTDFLGYFYLKCKYP